MTMPMPQLNTRSISWSATPPCSCSQMNSGGRGQAVAFELGSQAIGQDARNVLERGRRP